MHRLSGIVVGACIAAAAIATVTHPVYFLWFLGGSAAGFILGVME